MSGEAVNHPDHYKDESGLECIDVMLAHFGAERTADFCELNAFKYLWRAREKHDSPFEDWNKAQWYLNKACEIYKTKLERK